MSGARIPQTGKAAAMSDEDEPLPCFSKEPRPAGRGFCKLRGNISPLRYELPFLPALPSGASWQIFVNAISNRPLCLARARKIHENSGPARPFERDCHFEAGSFDAGSLSVRRSYPVAGVTMRTLSPSSKAAPGFFTTRSVAETPSITSTVASSIFLTVIGLK